MKKAIIIATLILIVKILPAQWVQVADLITWGGEYPGNQNLPMARFISEKIGYYVHTFHGEAHGCSYYIGKTTDGWNTFHDVYGQDGGSYNCYTIDDMTFLNDTIGYKLSAFSPYNVVQKTVNGGSSWTEFNNINTFEVYRISYPSEDLGYYLQSPWPYIYNFQVIVSDIGNCTVYNVAPENFKHATGISFINDSTGFIFCQDTLGNYVCIRSSDSAQTWNNVLNMQLNKGLAIQFPTEQVGYIAGQNGMAYKSIDAGISWTQLSTGVTENLNSVFFINELEGYIVGNSGAMISTIDGGQNWTIEDSGTNLDILSFYFNENGQGLFATKNYIFKSSYAGFEEFDKTNEKDNLVIYPNPASNIINIKLGELKKVATISIFSIQGKELIRKEYTGNSQIDINHLSPGLYFLRIINGNQIISQRFIKK